MFQLQKFSIWMLNDSEWSTGVSNILNHELFISSLPNSYRLFLIWDCKTVQTLCILTEPNQGETDQRGDLQYWDHSQRLLHQQGPEEHLRQGEGDEEEVQVLGGSEGEESAGEAGGGQGWLRHQRWGLSSEPESRWISINESVVRCPGENISGNQHSTGLTSITGISLSHDWLDISTLIISHHFTAHCSDYTLVA